MSAKKNDVVKINLTKTQKVQVKKETGIDADALELKVNELEERIAPKILFR